MFGGAPTMLPGFGSPFPGANSAVPNFGSPMMSQPLPRYGVAAPPPPARPPLAQQQPPAPRIIRGQRPEEPVAVPRPPPAVRPAALQMPSPQELGIADSKRPDHPSIDWTAVHNQLDHLGASCFHLERTHNGGYRITCLLPTNQRDRTHRIECDAATEGEAVRLILAKAQEWAGGR